MYTMHRKSIRYLIKYQFIHKLIKASRKVILPGFEGIPLYIVSKFFIQGMQNGALLMRAQSLAFSFFLALFPSIIFLFTLIPYIPIDNFQESLFGLLQGLFPQAAYEAAEETIVDIIKNQHSGLLSFGFISALYFSTNGFNSMMTAFNETYHDIETRSVLRQRFVALVMVIITTSMIAIAITLIIFSELALQRLIKADSVVYYLILFGKWFVLIALCFCFISVNYFLGPKRKKGFNFFSPGSIVATVLTIISSLIFTYYVNHFGNYNKLYGSIGTLIVIMLWIFINSVILLLGFDLNVSILSAKAKHNKAISKQKSYILKGKLS
jgi:membrane protein